VRVYLLDYIFLGLLAVVTAMSIKVVGIILVPALLVIPAATAKNISKSFKQMVFYSALFGVIGVIGGLIGSFYLNTASGATIVLLSILFFIITLAFRNSP
jgi:zinc transport system permease protein